MDLPTLDALLTAYGADEQAVPSARPLTPSPIAPEDLARCEAQLGIQLPTDYRGLLLAYDLTAIEFNFTRFYPYAARQKGILNALTDVLRDPLWPFSGEYWRWGVVPVGEDGWNNELIVVVRKPSEPVRGQPTQKMEDPLASTRPYGSVWAYYPDEMHPSMKYSFEFVGSSFAQVLHMALLCSAVSSPESRVAVTTTEVSRALTKIDPSSRDTPYWQLWIESTVAH